MPEPTRLPSGYNNIPEGNRQHPLRMLPAPDPTRLVEYFNDFLSYDTDDWTLTQSGGTVALADGDGGLATLTASTGGTDYCYLQVPKLQFYPEVGKQLWFEARLKLDAVSTGKAVVGLVAQDATPIANTDGIYFAKDTAGTGAIDFVVKKTSTATTAAAIKTAVADTFVRLGFYYDGKSTISYYVDGVKAGDVAATNLPSAGLTVTIALLATSAAERVLTVDYVYAAKERRVFAAY